MYRVRWGSAWARCSLAALLHAHRADRELCERIVGLAVGASLTVAGPVPAVVERLA